MDAISLPVPEIRNWSHYLVNQQDPPHKDGPEFPPHKHLVAEKFSVMEALVEEWLDTGFLPFIFLPGLM